ncbi:sulfatase-like hydrolase/transferase [Polaribacter sp. Z014]|uniref:sulfatase-like hydrolase/transferase n=1 Tax=Polaribacter sp. Z014 TaxID=2927126 RepID=UPI00201FE433|nr:sulfatase-like hydrolase/transferase [Polaribacter sp. Z014]MCL7764519.1 sulfatase-like hydrolase/transferase [Polaribacter sp. Z014]
MKINYKVFVLLSAVLLTSKLVIAQKQQQPNVLWVLTDDHRYDAISSFNKILTGKEESELGYVESPNIDRLGTMGTTFINTYCQASGCAPSRASMHYGRYPFRSGVYEFEYHNNNTENSYPHLPEQMEKMGYQTVHVGKLGVRLRTIKNGKAVAPEMYQTDISSILLSYEGMAEWGKMGLLKEIDGQKLVKPFKNIKYLKTEDGKYHYFSKELEEQNPQFAGMAKAIYDKLDLLRKHTPKKPETEFSQGILGGVSPRPAGETRDGFYNSSFKEFLSSENKEFKLGTLTFNGIDTSKPLFCHIGYDFPHTPVLPPKEYRERFQKHTYKLPKLTKEEWAKMPKQLKKQVNNAYSNEFTDDQKQQMIQDYYAFCAYGDDLVGESVDAFIKYSENKKQPWLVVYVNGDHGWKLNEHGAYSKFTPWEIDAHNPIIVVSSDKKAFPAGKVVTDYTEFVDIAPTIIAAGGANIDTKEFKYLDGMNLADVASGKAIHRDYVVGESHAVTGPRAYIRTKEYAFSMQTRPSKKRGVDMNWAVNAEYKDLDPALFDMTNDPQETNNLAFDKKYQKIAKQLKDKLTNIVLGDNRAEVNWGKGMKATGTKVYKNNFAPGAHDYKLKLEK